MNKPYHKYKSSGVNWLSEIPEHWDMCRVKNIFEIKKRIVGEEGYNVLSITQKGIKIKDIESGKGQLASDYSKYQLVEVGDFAMNHMDLLTGFIDISKFVGVTSPDYRVFSITKGDYSPRYFLYVFQMCYTNKIFYGLGQGSSLLGRWRYPTYQFYNFRIPIPSIHEQQAIAEFLDKKIEQIDRLIEKKQQELGLLKELRDVITHNAIQSSNVQYLKLGDIASIEKRAITRQNTNLYTPIGINNKGRGLFHKELTKGIDLGDSNFFEIQASDFIISGQFAWEGAIALTQKEDANCIASHRFHILRGKPNLVETSYLYSFFGTEFGQKLLNHHSRGAAGRNRPLNLNNLLREKIPVPPLSMQKTITNFIEKEFTLKNNTIMLMDILREYRTAIIFEAISGKIDVR